MGSATILVGTLPTPGSEALPDPKKTTLFRTLQSGPGRAETAGVARTHFRGIVEPVWHHFQEPALPAPDASQNQTESNAAIEVIDVESEAIEASE